MTQEPETLTQLVAERVGGEGSGLTYRAFERQAVDPKSGYKPGRSTLHKISKGLPVMLSPDLVNAVAAGLGLPPERVQRAAAFQYTGYHPSAPVGAGVVVGGAGATLDDLSKSRALVDGWEAEEEAATQGNHSST